METGIVGLLAPQLKNVRWIDENGEGRSPLTLDELGHGIRILYFFQDWCPGCHTHGFPTFVKLVDRFHGKGVGFAAIQTVFEGSDVNTFDRLRANQLRYRLRVPFGYAGAVSSDTVPNIMEAYRSGGTPWFVVVEPDARVVYNGFQINVESFIQAQ